MFTREFVLEGTCLLEFVGRLKTSSEVPFPLPPEQDHYLQVGRNVFRGPTGEMDNLINHSCDPNCRIVIHEYDAYVVAMRDIVRGEEITFDYSTTSTDSPAIWSMACACGSVACRGEISGFRTVPDYRQAFYITRDAVPAYVLDTLDWS